MNVISSEVLLCTVVMLCVSVALKRCSWACRPTSLMVSPCRRTRSTIVLCISSGMTFELVSFNLIFLSSSSLSLTTRIHSLKHIINHMCACSYHPEILTCVSSVLLLNVHTGINVCCLSLFCDAWVIYIVCLCFLNENMVKPVQDNAIFV